jgi:hypothetical protein
MGTTRTLPIVLFLSETPYCFCLKHNVSETEFVSVFRWNLRSWAQSIQLVPVSRRPGLSHLPRQKQTRAVVLSKDSFARPAPRYGSFFCGSYFGIYPAARQHKDVKHPLHISAFRPSPGSLLAALARVCSMFLILRRTPAILLSCTDVLLKPCL